MIFLFIAGTYTPFALLAVEAHGLLDARHRVGRRHRGVALKMLWPTAPRWVGVPLYIALGWVAVFVMPDSSDAGVAALVLIGVGGLLYTMGAVFYAVKWPNHWPETFGYHEYFHACTVLAAVPHYVAIWLALYA